MHIEKLQEAERRDIVEGDQQFTRYPDTNILLEELPIPYMKEACQLAIRATNYISNRVIGWDIAITNDGPIIIEGNEKRSLHITDVAYGGYLKNNHVKALLMEIKQ